MGLYHSLYSSQCWEYWHVYTWTIEHIPTSRSNDTVADSGRLSGNCFPQEPGVQDEKEPRFVKAAIHSLQTRLVALEKAYNQHSSEFKRLFQVLVQGNQTMDGKVAELLFSSNHHNHTVVFSAGLIRLLFLPFVFTEARSLRAKSLQSSDSG